MSPKISVIIPIYKVEAYLCQCIDSIIMQTYTNLEIILINDGSPDNCGKICDKYAQKDNRIVIIHKENEGHSAARNIGIELASGEYLTFIDSDDWIESDMIELLYNILINNNADVSCCGYYTAYLNSNKSTNYSNEILFFDREQAIKQMLLNKYIFCSVCIKLYKKSLFNTIRFSSNITYGEDAALTIEILSLITRIVSIDCPKYYYRQRKGSLVHTSYDKKNIEIIEIAEKILKIIESDYPNITEIGIAGLLNANLKVLSRIIFVSKYKKLLEYKKILTILKKNYKFMIKNDVFNRNEKIKIITIKINIRLYKLLQTINNWEKNKILFE